MAVTPEVSPWTWTGTDESVVVSLPSWPKVFDPQHHAPPDTTAHEWLVPVAIAVTPDVSPWTATGTDESVVELLPSWPDELSPQHFAAPPAMPQVWLAPGACFEFFCHWLISRRNESTARWITGRRTADFSLGRFSGDALQRALNGRSLRYRRMVVYIAKKIQKISTVAQYA